MPNKRLHTILLTACVSLLTSCFPVKFTSNYYYQHATALDRIEASYKELYLKGPFTVGFSDKKYQIISLQIITDTLNYIYEFGVNESRLTDTLTKYHLDADKITDLIRQMQEIRCTWVKNYEYYTGEKKNSLIFLSVKPVLITPPLSAKKYYILTYFTQPQYFDQEGKLLDRRKLRRLRKINGEIFHRINDKVCYTTSGNFR
jgi:hypothetical protein